MKNLFFALLFFLPFSLLAQSTTQNFVFDTDEKTFLEQIKSSPTYIPSYGMLFNATDIASGRNNSLILTLRPWLGMSVTETSSFMLRGKYRYTKFLATEPGITIKDDNLFDLDIASYDYTGSKIVVNAGRRFFYSGQGILLNGRADGFETNFDVYFAKIQILYAYSGLLRADSNPFNISSKDYTDGAKRSVLGTSFSFDKTSHNFKLIYLWQKDHTGIINNAGNEYTVSYLGVSATGTFLTRLTYSTIAIYEFGKSYITGTTTKSNVSAFGFVSNLSTFLDYSIKPKLFFDLAYGSGDKDRNSATSPTGNVSGNDNSFIYFGTFQGGLGLRPKLSNLVVIDIGGSIIPYKNIQISTKLLQYFKAVSQGVIQSGEATENSSNVGFGMDIFLGWQVFSDLTINAAYGLFKPASAYSASLRKARQLLMLGLNLSI